MKTRIAALTVILVLVFIFSPLLAQKIENVDGVKVIHNDKAKWGKKPKVALEFVRQIGEFEAEDENYQFFRPEDIVKDKDGNIYINDSGNCRIQKFDSDGNYLNGSKAYRLTLPKGIPAKDFWSVTLYDPQSRSMLQTPRTAQPSLSSQSGKPAFNDDGSCTLYFGPKAPEGKESNWIQTVPGKGWFAILRLDGPLEPWFEPTAPRQAVPWEGCTGATTTRGP